MLARTTATTILTITREEDKDGDTTEALTEFVSSCP